MANSKSKLKFIIFLVIIAISILLAIFVFPSLSSEKIEESLRGIGSWAVPVYVTLFAILPGFLLPVIVLIFPAGVLFGFFWGSIYTLIGAIINMAWMFLVSRYLARDVIHNIVTKRLSPKWQHRIQKSSSGREGFLFMILLRVTPLIPYNLINYVYGLSNMNFWSYMVSSFIGIIPGTLAYLNLGDKVLNPASSEFALAVGFLVILAIVSSALAKKYFDKPLPEEAEVELLGDNRELDPGTIADNLSDLIDNDPKCDN